jgi:hypothetical protein
MCMKEYECRHGALLYEQQSPDSTMPFCDESSAVKRLADDNGENERVEDARFSVKHTTLARFVLHLIASKQEKERFVSPFVDLKVTDKAFEGDLGDGCLRGFVWPQQKEQTDEQRKRERERERERLFDFVSYRRKDV